MTWAIMKMQSKHEKSKKVNGMVTPGEEQEGKTRRSWGESIQKALSARNLTDEHCQDKKYWGRKSGNRTVTTDALNRFSIY